MNQVDVKNKKWKKDIAHLKDIDAFDFKEANLVFILMDSSPGEVHKEVAMKHETVGNKSRTIKQLLIAVAQIMAKKKTELKTEMTEERQNHWEPSKTRSRSTAAASATTRARTATATPTTNQLVYLSGSGANITRSALRQSPLEWP